MGQSMTHPMPITNTKLFFFFFLKMIIIQNQWTKSRNNISNKTIAHPWYDGHSISISACEVWGVRVGVQVSKREIYTHIHLDYIKVEILSKKKKNHHFDYSTSCCK